MKQRLLALGLPLLCWAPAAHGFTYWNSFRTSALQPGDLVTARVENPHGPQIANAILYLGETVVEVPLAAVADGPSTVAALVPGPVDLRRYYGFRLLQPGQRDLLPVGLPDGTNPVPGQLTLLADDPIGDEIFGRPHLDLVECRVSLSSTRLYATLRNVSGGFPVSQSLAFFGYLFGLSNPAETNPEVVWALLQTYSVPGIIGPGLYRVSGTGLGDLTRIGDITVQEFPAQNTLMLSCRLSDLLGDPAFAAWFNPADPRAAVGAFTQRITLTGGAVEADRIAGGCLHLRALSRDPVVNTLPQLEDLLILPPDPQAYAQIEYTDAEQHCPVFSEIVFSTAGGAVDAFPLFPQSLDYAGPVVYRTEPGIPPLASGDWDSAEVRFSDNLTDVVAFTVSSVAVAETGARVQSALRLERSPNPFTERTAVRFRLPAAGPVRLTLHDLAGRTVAVLAAGEYPSGVHTVAWSGRGADGRRQPAGAYFFRLRTRQGEEVRRVTLLR